MDNNTAIMIIMIVLFAGGSIALAYMFSKASLRVRTVSKYHKHIKATMNLPEVKEFLASAKKPFIELDQNERELIVIWRDENSTNSVQVYVDKETMNINKVLKRT